MRIGKFVPDKTADGLIRLNSAANAEVELRKLIPLGFRFYRSVRRSVFLEEVHGDDRAFHVGNLRNILFKYQFVCDWTAKALYEAARKLADEKGND